MKRVLLIFSLEKKQNFNTIESFKKVMKMKDMQEKINH